jgi:hypothetical protein
VVAYRPPGEVIYLDGLNAMSKKAVGYEICGYWRFLEREDAGEIVNKNVSIFVSTYFVLVMKTDKACS